MIQCRCLECRLVWIEDRGQGNSPIGPYTYLCPRCGKLAIGIVRVPEDTEKEK